MAKDTTSIFKTLETEGRKVLGRIQSEIHDLETQLMELRDQAERWASALEERTRPGKGGTATKRPPRRKSPPTDWDAVLKRLPKTFTTKDVATKTPKLNPYPKARIMAVARWTRQKQVKKTGPGKYQKLA